jgi:hypothetical protein
MAQSGTAAGRHAAPRQAVVGTAPRTIAPQRDVAGCDAALCAPALMKMGTIVSPWRYDATFNFAQLLPGGVREPPILLR